MNDYQINELTNRIIKAAATNTLPIDFLTATTKALAALIVTTARRDETPLDELLKVSQEAVSEATKVLMNEMENKNIFPVKGPWDERK